MARVVAAAGHAELAARAPPSVPPLAAAALPARPAGAGVPVLLVTAGERDADQVADQLRCFLPDRRTEVFPAWETLPHERLSPRADTVGRRLAVLRDLTHPGANGTIDVLVAPVRSVLQPLSPGLGDLVPVELRPGDTAELDDAAPRAGAPRPGGAAAGGPRRARRRRTRARRRRLHPRGAGREARRVRRPRRPARRLPAHRAAPGPRRVLGRRGRRAALLLRGRPALARRAAGAPVGAAVPRAAADRRGAGPRDRARGRAPQPGRDPGQAGRGHRRRGHGVADPGPGGGGDAAAHRPPAGRHARA